MSAIVHKEFDSNLRPRERNAARNWGLPRIALRERVADRPMVLFFVVTAATFAAMAAVPPTGAAFATFDSKPKAVAAATAEAPETNVQQNVGLSEIDIACEGQAWGAQSAACLAAIAKESGHTSDGRKIRVIAGA